MRSPVTLSASLEQAVAQRLRALAQASSSLPESPELTELEAALERFVPATLALGYPWWQFQSFDRFRFAVATRSAGGQAELVGLGLLIGPQTWTPIHLQIGVTGEDEVWFDCKVGWPGDGPGGLLQVPYGSTGEGTLLDEVVGGYENAAWVYRSSRGIPRSAA
jgi:hypothetical protein